MLTIVHVVILKFKANVREETITDLFSQLRGLKKLIPGIVQIAAARKSSDEGLMQKRNYGFLVEFESTADRDRYLTHPEYEHVKQSILPNVTEMISVDFET